MTRSKHAERNTIHVNVPLTNQNTPLNFLKSKTKISLIFFYLVCQKLTLATVKIIRNEAAD